MKHRYIPLFHVLTTKPEFRRLVRREHDRLKGMMIGGKVSPALAEVVALGHLAKLWLTADLHIRDDDTLDLSADEVDQLLGIERAAEVLGPNYLQVLDTNHTVKLPNYGTHNDASGRAAFLNAERQRRHREKVAFETITRARDSSNGGALRERDKDNAGALPPNLPNLSNPSESKSATPATPNGASRPDKTTPPVAATAATIAAPKPLIGPREHPLYTGPKPK